MKNELLILEKRVKEFLTTVMPMPHNPCVEGACYDYYVYSNEPERKKGEQAILPIIECVAYAHYSAKDAKKMGLEQTFAVKARLFGLHYRFVKHAQSYRSPELQFIQFTLRLTGE